MPFPTTIVMLVPVSINKPKPRRLFARGSKNIFKYIQIYIPPIFSLSFRGRAGAAPPATSLRRAGELGLPVHMSIRGQSVRHPDAVMHLCAKSPSFVLRSLSGVAKTAFICNFGDESI